ncbi:hypothetical protein PLEOSDRAFT_1091231 [Pleurotus ostreatus PC15]|uniref:Uncharacterized protein n=1 Tax=Pleurotus ostreatus (strain PC15) TaxID=1137138 RepID=A0A067NXU4_PLEO1|nr:hypothetical protein PLEOSDRAFT_1091231 [Pleurotus ostreatus PC15]
MFNLVRRISRSFIPRPDRPWEEDPTSNAPQIGRKRRLSTTELGDGPSDEERLTKRGRGALPPVAVETTTENTSQNDTREASPVSPPHGATTDQEDVKEVTEGVKEVELEDKKEVGPESVPLPVEVSGELDEVSATPAEGSKDESKAEAENDDVASSRSSSVPPQPAEAVDLALAEQPSQVTDERTNEPSNEIPNNILVTPAEIVSPQPAEGS